MNPIRRVLLALIIFSVVAWSLMFIPALSRHAMAVFMLSFYIAPLFGIIFLGITLAICSPAWRLKYKKEIIIAFIVLLLWLIILIIGVTLNWFR